MGERSTPRTVVEGYWSAKSIAQIPVPHPTSRARFGDESTRDRKKLDGFRLPRYLVPMEQDEACHPESGGIFDGFTNQTNILPQLWATYAMSSSSFCRSSLGALYYKSET